MKANKLILSLFLSIFFGLTFGQTVNILVNDPLPGSNYPEIPIVNSAYTNAGFTTVNITQDTISSNVDTSNYDIVIVTESYSISGGGLPLFLSSTQRQILENFIQDGGHVIWNSENWDTYPIIGGPAPVNSNSLNTINTIYGTNLSFGPYFDNGGMGSPNLPRIHPSNGPGGLSSSATIVSSGSYATLLNVPNLNAVYTSGPFANFISFDICTHTTIGLFPAQPTSAEGSVIISTELAVPFAGIVSGFGGPTIYNTSFDSDIATMHFNLITGVSMTATNNWSDTIANTNTSCIPLEAIISTSIDTICLGETITFTDSSTGNPSSWNWTFTNGTPATANTQGAHTIAFNTAGTHNIILQVGDGTDTDDTTIQVVVNPVPNIDAGTDSTICDGENITLTAINPDAATISWNNGVTDAVAFAPVTTTTYIVTADLNGCISTDSVEISVQTCLPIEAIFNLSSDTICIGDSITFTDASSGSPSSWNWTFTNGMPATANTQGAHTIAFNTAGTHNIILQVGDGTDTDDTTIQVVVNPVPNIDAGTDSTICDGENITLTAINPDAATISWNNGVTDAVAFAPVTTTTYIVTADLNGCISTDSVEISVQTCLPIEAIFNLSSDTICIGDSITFTDASSGSPSSWNWTFTNGMPATANTQGAHTVAFNTAGTHNIILQVGDGTDTDDTTIQVVVNPVPNIDAGTDSTICDGENITLTAINPDAATISWNNGVTDAVAFTPVTTTTYIVTADLNGCITQDNVTITVNSVSTSNVNVTICEGQNYILPDGSSVDTIGSYPVTLTSASGCDSTITTNISFNTTGTFDPLTDVQVCSSFSLVLDVNAQNMTNIEWFINDGSGFVSLIGNLNYSGANTSALTIALDTSLHGNIYRVIMSDNCGGSYNSQMTLEVYTPQALANPHPDISFCAHEKQLLTLDYNGYNFEWNTGKTGRTIEPKESGTYVVNFIENGTECRMTDEIEVEIEDCIADCTVGIATGFSPNGDGVNDKLKGLSTCNDGFKEFEFILANRWGEIIFKSTDPGFEWDGVYKNKPIEIGVYSYSIVYVKNFSEVIINDKGTVTVIK